jgi:PAS domain S-box-containing protein
MKDSGIKHQDTAAFGKTMQGLLMAAFSQANWEPFLKKILETLSGPGGLGHKSSLAIIVKSPRELAAFHNTPASEKREILSGLKKTYGAKSRLNLCAEIRTGGAPAGRVLARLNKNTQNPESAARLIETTARIITARISNEKRDSELAFERDLSSSVKHIEELYLAFPGISIEEISRAVMDEARRMTGSAFGFTGHIDQATGWLLTSALTVETCNRCRMMEKPVVFTEFNGLWGWVLKRKKTLLTNRANKDRRAAGLPPGHIKIDKFLGVPAMSGRKLLGILAVANPAENYGPEGLEAAQKLARVYAMILHRKLEEDRQKEEDSRFKAIISSSKDIIYTANLAGRITYISPRVEEYGYRQEEVAGHSISEFAHPDDKDFVEKAYANAVATGRTLPILPCRARKKDGSYFYVEQKSGVVTHGGKPLYITGVIRDVTEQKKTETRLKESEALMRMVFDTAKDAIFIKDMNGMYMKANKACADMMHTTPEGMIGHTDSDYFPKKTAADVFRTDSEVVRTGKTLSLNTHHSFPGGSRYLNIVKTPFRSVTGETIGLLGIARDISDLKKMERELALAGAADAVSRVAKPMAHDFNNALAAINGYATLINDDLSGSSPIKNEISLIIKAVKRAAELTDKFQDFARNPRITGQEGGDA